MKRITIFVSFLALLLVGPWICALIYGFFGFFLFFICNGFDIPLSDREVGRLVLIVTGLVFSILAFIVWGRFKLLVNKPKKENGRTR